MKVTGENGGTWKRVDFFSWGLTRLGCIESQSLSDFVSNFNKAISKRFILGLILLASYCIVLGWITVLEFNFIPIVVLFVTLYALFPFLKEIIGRPPNLFIDFLDFKGLVVAHSRVELLLGLLIPLMVFGHAIIKPWRILLLQTGIFHLALWDFLERLYIFPHRLG